MKLSSFLLITALLTVGALAHANGDDGDKGDGDKGGHGGPPQCTPEPISMIGLGIAGLGLIRARMKKNA